MVLGSVSAAGLVVGTIASIALVPWMRIFFGTLSVAVSGVASVGALVVWDRSGSPRMAAAALAFAGVGAVLLRWGRATDQRPQRT